MSKKSRDKGARGEREVIRILQPVVDEVCAEVGMPSFELIRDTRQRFEAKHYDVFGLPWMAFEVKYREDMSGIESWWKQTRDACRPGQIPVMFYRRNHGRWRVRMRAPISVVKGGWSPGDGTGPEDTYHRPVRVSMTMDVRLSDWLVWFRVKLKYELI